MKNSFKQLLRTPAKTTLFFLLMAAATLLLVFSSSLLSETSQRIDEVENSFTTLARVEQVPALADVLVTWYNECWGLQSGTTDVWDERVSTETLNVEGLNYVNSPEYRPYYFIRQPEWNHSQDNFSNNLAFMIEFTALEDSDELGAANVRVERSLLQAQHIGYGVGEEALKEGVEIFLCQCGGTRLTDKGIVVPLEAGKRYVGTVFPMYGCLTHEEHNWDNYAPDHPWGIPEYIVFTAPYSTQRSSDGELIQGDHFPAAEDGTQFRFRVEEVTEDFWEEGGRGQDWLTWAAQYTHDQELFPVMPVTNLQMLPIFQEHQAYVNQGREITPEEYESGALVCMVPEDMMGHNLWQVGDKIRLPLTYAVYGPDAAIVHRDMGPLMPSVSYFVLTFSTLRADGKPYDVFWDEEYEIVGTYSLVSRGNTYNNGEIYPDTILIPRASVGASDADNIAGYNYMDGITATFQIENGTIEDFDAALRAAVPEAESLVITYNDNGYTEIMESLQNTRTAALLLFVVGLLAALAIVLLLLYFFIARERKRTAIERSLGMSKRQCRASLLAGVLAITVLATGIGTAGGAVAMSLFHGQNNAVQEEVQESHETAEIVDAAQVDTIENYNPKYSLWAKADKARQELTEEYSSPVSLYFAIPLALVLLVLALSFLLVERNLKIEPIYLLSGKME